MIYVCFDAGTDIHYYRLMTAWNVNTRFNFNFDNAHHINNIRDGSSEETIKRKLRERLRQTKILVVLIGENTRNLYKYVRWEIEFAIENNIPIIAVNLNGKESLDHTLCPPILKTQLAIHISFGPKILDYSIKNWPYWHNEYRLIAERDYCYPSSVYNG